MKLTRRNFLKVGAAAGVVAASNITYEMTRGMSHSLPSVAEESDGWFYRGFPSRVEKAGFETRPLIQKPSASEVIIFGEFDHNEKGLLRKEAELIDFLIEQHGYTSLCLEGQYGGPSETLDEDIDKEFIEFFEGKTIITDKSRQIHRNGKLDYETGPIIERPKRPAFEKFLKQKSIPTFGIEDKELYFETIAIHGIMKCIDYVNRHTHTRDWTGPITSTYDLVPNTEQLEDFVKVVKKRFPGMYLPGDNLKDIAENCYKKNQQCANFIQYEIQQRILRTNPRMAANLESGMKKLGSKRSIVVIGEGHLCPPEQHVDGIEYFCGERRVMPGLKPLQEYMASSALIVNAFPEKQASPI